MAVYGSIESGAITFEVDQTQLQRIELLLKNMSDKAPQALKNAVNATARDAKTDLADKAKETYAVKTPKFKQAIAQKNATNRNPTATLTVSGSPNELIDFKYKSSSGDAVRAKVLKSSSYKELDKSGIKAFVVGLSNKKNTKIHVTIAQRKGDARLPIKTLYSNSIPKMIGNEAKVYGIIRPEIEANLQKNIQKQVAKLMKGQNL